MAELVYRSGLDRPLTSIEADGNIAELAARSAANLGAIEDLAEIVTENASDIATLQGQVGPLLGAQNNVGRWINYGFQLDNGELDGTDITIPLVVAYINALAFPVTVTETQTPVVFEFQKSFVEGTRRYIFFFLRGKGNWGATGGLGGGTAVVSADFKMLPVVKLVFQDLDSDPNTVTFDLGEIDPADFLTEANSEDRELDNEEFVYYFIYTADGVEYSMRFVGTAGAYGGGGTALVEDDFVAGPTSETTPEVPLMSPNRKKFEYPAAWQWRPCGIFKLNGRWYVDIEMKNIVAEKIAGLRPYYVDFNNGSNSNKGFTKTTAFKTINYALTQGAKLIYLLPGIHQSSTFTGNINNSSYGSDDKFIIATQPEKTFIVHNTEGTLFSAYGAIYRADMSATVSGQATRSAVDFMYTDRYGMPYRLQEKASIAEVEATPGSFFFDATPDMLYVRLLDDRAPDSKVFNLTHNSPPTWQGSSNNEYLYMEGITFLGGNGAMTLTTVGSNAYSPGFLINNCRFLYSSAGGVRITSTGGVLWFHNCLAYDNATDGFNYAQHATLTSQKALETFCLSFNNGRTPFTDSSLVNASSVHNNITIIRVGCKGWDNVGPNYIDVRGNRSLLVGCEAFNSLGYDDGSFTVHWSDWGDFVTGSDTGTPSEMYLYDCRSSSTNLSFSTPPFLIDGVTPDNSQMYVQECEWVGPYAGNINFGYAVNGAYKKWEFPALSSYTAYNEGLQSTVLLRNNVTPATVTGTTSETIIDYAALPAGIGFGILRSILRGSKTGTAGAITYRYYLSTTTDLTGSLGQIGAVNGASNQSSPWFERNFIFTSDGNVRGANFVGSVDIDQSSFNTALSSLAANPSTTSYNVVVTAQLAVSTDGFALYNHFSEYIKQK